MYLQPSCSLPYFFVLNFCKIPSSAARLSSLEHPEIMRWFEKYRDRLKKYVLVDSFDFCFLNIHIFPNFSAQLLRAQTLLYEAK